MNITNYNFEDLNSDEWLDTDEISESESDVDDLIFNFAIPILNVTLPAKTV